MDVVSLGGPVRSGYDSFVPPEVPLPYKSAVTKAAYPECLFRCRQLEEAGQLITIVTTPVSLNRPPLSFGKKFEISGMTRSW
jgi:hypothetical protein